MSSSFHEREKAFENKFKLDEETRFRVNARAVKLLGLWAAAQLGLDGADADAYAGEVIESDFDEPGPEDVFRKVHGDFTAKGLDISLHHIENQYLQHLDEARVALQQG